MGNFSLKAPSKNLFLSIEGVKKGPFQIQDIRDYFDQGKINYGTFLWYPGLLNWVTVGDLPDFNRRESTAPPPLPGQQAQSQTAPEEVAVWVFIQGQVLSKTLTEVEALVKDKKLRRADYVYEDEKRAWTRADQHEKVLHNFPPDLKELDEA